MERIFPKHPSDVLFLILSKLQRWGILLRSKEKELFDEQRLKLEAWAKDFSKTVSMDVGV
ncbi:hypothetical protein GQ55_9G095700 [Panicum hallii var. hallii]|uniref:Uncharacterized protein n=1 Tax=Panicum hallii var. hallii TaxID=1504633 RepID=A0A2T7C1C9_9POAL|nr:hypothetical protein GQ55_9G095700 [Panicum hallii var. hallii]